MIDTVSLYLSGLNGRDFEVNTDKFYSVRSPSIEGGGAYNYYNTFYEDEKEKTKAINVKFDAGNNYLLITFSVPKLVYGNSLENFKVRDKEKIFDCLKGRLRDTVDVYFENMMMSRMDVCKNLKVEYEVPIYINSLKNAVEVNKRYRVQSYERESLVIANKSKRFTIYDKVAEQRKLGELKGELKGGRWRGGNILRFEVQHKKGKTIKDAFGREFTFGEIFTDGAFMNFNAYLVRLFDKSFTNYGMQDMFINDLSLIEVIKGYSKRDILKNFLIKRYLKEKDYDFKYYEDLLISSGMSKSGVYKSIKGIERLKHLGSAKVGDVLDEVRDKLVA